jgi:hypothetical protein
MNPRSRLVRLAGHERIREHILLTPTIDDDVLDSGRELSKRSGRSFRRVINEALRQRLSVAEEPLNSRPTKVPALGMRRGYSLENIQGLLSELDGEQAG